MMLYCSSRPVVPGVQSFPFLLRWGCLDESDLHFPFLDHLRGFSILSSFCMSLEVIGVG